ncbi:hypothetical protein NM688_g2455 [Phlebia brevispora]|uniref:Uncharacterized protein n=1 Tax=Phlebia brevispora TaxID=194682 RepID=A0ACC1T8N0_9APHY|nr:hypothetical protein NM688_g2455 [Phlebia brevispora]
MPPPSPSDHPAFRLTLLPRIFRVEQYKTTEKIPSHFLELLTGGTSAQSQGSSARRAPFVSVTRTDEEVSIVYEVEFGGGGSTSNEIEATSTWRCIKIAGPMDFGITGVMCNFSMPLKLASIPIFAVSTWNTDYVLVPEDKASNAVDVLKADGWAFIDHETSV